MPHRLVLCFDGTWDRPDNTTDVPARVQSNVCWIYESVINGTVPDGTQLKWYDTGVGTNWYDRIAGGAFGFGLDQKIQDGYQWLVNNLPSTGSSHDYHIFVTGFSRGAYTARSLVGMIRNVGLLRPENVHRVGDAYALYRQRDASADTAEAVAFRAQYAREVKIQFLGVWDTVGALGIPLDALHTFNAEAYGFHDTELSGIVANAAHAVAIDEHRVDYQVALWDPIPKPGQVVEQRWFIGAHADVGGGYQSRLLSNTTLAWMQQQAVKAGLVLDPAKIPPVTDMNAQAPISDSYKDFLFGAYAATHGPYYRPISTAPGSNETIDHTASVRADASGYHPANPGFPDPLPAPWPWP